MTDYYAILGVTKTASETEIKASFRKLAKLYHPDKNPNNPGALAYFEQVLNAYNILSDYQARKRYDSAFLSNRSTQGYQKKHTQQQTTKSYTATDEELKRRAYYKNYYQRTAKVVNTQPPKATYSDYKYILFATPLAVGLLMLVMSVFTNEPVIKKENKQQPLIADTIHKS